MEKLKKTAAGLDTFFKITYNLSIAAIVISAFVVLFLWYLYLSDPDIAELFQGTLDFGVIEFRIADSFPPAGNSFILFLSLGTILSIAQLPVFCMIFSSIRGILAPIKEGTPFNDSITYYLKRLGWLTIANGVIDIVAGFVLQGNFLTQYDLGALFLSDKITQVTTHYSFNFTFVIYAVILFLMSYIFQYGGELQQLSDETL